ncbi:MAG: metallophosphoesterase [Verrucomicrobia bacterium]|nr:metallophosphoesterase [Verrucomicrobiota bacterium]MCF7707948.1 metallophosphoesterase [Verrucomicrobiota bacterium]
MKIAIISDIHDNIRNLRNALMKAGDAEALVCCGDLCSPFIIKELGQGFEGPVHIVFGNNDGDTFRMLQASQKFTHLTLHGEFADLDLDGKRFAVNHFDNIGGALAKSNLYDVVCFGHNHNAEINRTGKTLVINPGEVFGGLSGKSTFALYDTATAEAELVTI